MSKKKKTSFLTPLLNEPRWGPFQIVIGFLNIFEKTKVMSLVSRRFNLGVEMFLKNSKFDDNEIIEILQNNPHFNLLSKLETCMCFKNSRIKGEKFSDSEDKLMYYLNDIADNPKLGLNTFWISIPTNVLSDLFSRFVPCRSPDECKDRLKFLNSFKVKGSWTKEEDEKLLAIVEKKGPKKWMKIARSLFGRTGKQCRERYLNHLDPTFNFNPITEEEVLFVVDEFERIGRRWFDIGQKINRTANVTKNIYNGSRGVKILRKRMEENRNK